MAPPPTLVVVSDATAPPDALTGFDVVAVAATASDASLVEEVRAAGLSRWLLVGQGDGVDVVTRVAAAVLSGAAPVFGLAGLVLLGAAPAGGRPDLPTLVVGDDDDAARAVQRFWQVRAGRGPVVPDDFVQLLASDRVSARTRGIHARRALADDPDHVPTVLTPDQLATLRALAGRVVPQDDPTTSIDLAARVETQLAAGQGDGWRHADLPDDLATYRAALDELADLAGLGEREQDAAITAVAAGERATGGVLSGAQLGLWFEDACNDLVRQWVAHPATMARIGYDGLANGGDGERKQGFVRLGADEREPWEPRMTRETTPATTPATTTETTR